MSDCLSWTLSEVCDRYFIRRGISKKKYFLRYMVIAEEVWRKVFMNTLWVVQSKWMELKSGDPYNYVEVPAGCLRLLGVGVTDRCNLVQPLFYNNQINVIKKPVRKSCGCDCDECGGVCEDASTMTTTTKLMFTINGIEYFQKCWIETCKNGDIIEFCRTPVREYLDLIGDSGDYNIDYMDDYDIAHEGFANYRIVYRETQRLICKLETHECGCPKDTESNQQVLLDNCGCFLSWGTRHKKKHCQKFFENVNNNHFGEVKISDCGGKIFFRPSKHWKQSGAAEKFPTHLLVNFQTDGKKVGQEILIPEYAANLMYAGLDYESKAFNNAYSSSDKLDAKYRYEDERSEVLKFMNPISLEFMEQVQDLKISW